MKFENTFDNTFRQKAREIKVNPTDHVWAKIDSRLSQRKRTSVYSIVGIAASLLLLVGMFSLYATAPAVYENPNYQVIQASPADDAAFDTALMNWISFSRKS